MTLRKTTLDESSVKPVLLDENVSDFAVPELEKTTVLPLIVVVAIIQSLP